MKLLRLSAGIVSVLAAVCAVTTPASAQSVNNFSFDSFDADYYLTRDAQKHSHLKVHETLVAEFPDFNQNHGIERAIPQRFDGHNLHVKVTSVTDETGHPLTYKKSTSNGNTVVRIGDANRYVHGRQTYQLYYDFKDVTKGFDGHDELFWNTNGTQWLQTFNQVTARLHVEAGLAKAYDNRTRCIMGALGSTEACSTVAHEETDGSRLFTFAAGRPLQYGENLSYVVGFSKDTFAAYTPTTWERLFPTILKIWLVANALFLAGCILFAARIWWRHGRSAAGKGTIVPEYLPPKNMSVLISGVIIKKTAPAPTAQVIDLAVRHYLKVYEIPATGIFNRKPSYELEVVKDLQSLSSEEQALCALIFGSDKPQVGQQTSTKEIGRRLQLKLQTFLSDMDKQAQADGLYQDRQPQKSRYNKIGLLLLALSIILLSPGLFVGSIIIFITVSALKPLSQTGIAAKEYLEGLLMYIKLAEAERLKILQSPEGADKISSGIDPTDKRQLVKLYERLLPYAILYGVEKAWVKQFAVLYDQAPDWYAGNWSTFNAVVFASAISDFNSVSSTTFAPPASSSSSGFSGGSGGGGGGGGGGGW